MTQIFWKIDGFNLYCTLIIGERQYGFLNIQQNEKHK